MGEVYPETPVSSLAATPGLGEILAAKRPETRASLPPEWDAAAQQRPAPPGQAARKAWNDHWAGPDPYPASETQEETFERVWGEVAQAAITAGTAKILAEAARHKAERDGLHADRKRLTTALADVTEERDAAREQLAKARELAIEILDELDQWELLVEDDRRAAWRQRAADGGTT